VPKSGLSKADGAECYFRRSITSGRHRKSLCGLRLVNGGLFRYWAMEVYPTSRPSGFVNAAALVRTYRPIMRNWHSPREAKSGLPMIRPSAEVDTNLTPPLAPRKMPS